MKLANWVHEDIQQIKDAWTEFCADMQDPENVALLIVSVIVFVGLLAGSFLA
jgi:hypothetical protein